ncbi:hypothetical protein NDU88_009115 [Pleurodeles waltl]|uniref:Uncharacterized protein n=1 Tax=Pleurodeles waltl TaxID=8319 RepID=A0AAV7QTN6_PLEWA|nr:hypothetical protein NDU88_009115 [Pleurodeles waltl]
MPVALDHKFQFSVRFYRLLRHQLAIYLAVRARMGHIKGGDMAQVVVLNLNYPRPREPWQATSVLSMRRRRQGILAGNAASSQRHMGKMHEHLQIRGDMLKCLLDVGTCLVASSDLPLLADLGVPTLNVADPAYEVLDSVLTNAPNP